MITATEDAKPRLNKNFFQENLGMAKKARKEQAEAREPIYLTPDDYEDMGKTLMRAGEKMVQVADEMRKQGLSQMLQKAKQLKNTWVPWIIEFAGDSYNDIDGAAYAERRGVPSPKESTRRLFQAAGSPLVLPTVPPAPSHGRVDRRAT